MVEGLFVKFRSQVQWVQQVLKVKLVVMDWMA